VMLVGDPGLLPRLVPLGTGVDPLPRGRPAPRMIISTFSGITLAYALAPRCLASSAMPPGRKERESNPQGPKAHPFSRRDTTPMAALPRMTPAGVEPAELARLSSPYVGTRIANEDVYATRSPFNPGSPHTRMGRPTWKGVGARCSHVLPESTQH